MPTEGDTERPRGPEGHAPESLRAGVVRRRRRVPRAARSGPHHGLAIVGVVYTICGLAAFVLGWMLTSGHGSSGLGYVMVGLGLLLAATGGVLVRRAVAPEEGESLSGLVVTGACLLIVVLLLFFELAVALVMRGVLPTGS